MSASTAIASLRRFARAPGHARGTRPPAVTAGRCDLCRAPLDRRHEHLLEPEQRELRCACSACALPFAAPGARLRRVLPRAQRLAGLVIDDERWASLGVPIGLACFWTRGATGEPVAQFPGPAGAVMASPPVEAWNALVASHPALASLVPDVEALLVHRLGETHQHWHVSIDHGHRLFALLRRHWRGASGGAQVWTEVWGFFAELEEHFRD